MNTIRLSVRPALGWLRPLLKIGTIFGVAIGLAIALVGSLWAPTALVADNTLVSFIFGAGIIVDSSPTVVELKFV